MTALVTAEQIFVRPRNIYVCIYSVTTDFNAPNPESQPRGPVTVID